MQPRVLARTMLCIEQRFVAGWEATMYVLTIVFLISHVSITSLYATLESCELAAASARLFSQGPQAVASARCEPAKGMDGTLNDKAHLPMAWTQYSRKDVDPHQGSATG